MFDDEPEQDFHGLASEIADHYVAARGSEVLQLAAFARQIRQRFAFLRRPRDIGRLL
ncbi:hypothetical protein [Prauserella aidingensis]|uniref:hypothetical protein n=1 Tax=Prauserella aidingensis TaxID=387890 RepID=UPI0020A5B5F2|nr:hypothetical protein [Prauserella aidingensis]